MTALDVTGKSVLITGGATGIGAGVARRLRSLGANITIADVNVDAGQATAAEVDGVFVRTDVTDYQANVDAVTKAVDAFGGLDIALLNAGVASGTTFGPTFDPQRYRRAMAINLDGVVYGINAALPALNARGGGDIIATASMAGIAPVPVDPIYAANKSGVVALVRSFGAASVGAGVRTNAICPAFADTDILGPLREGLSKAGVPLLRVEEVVEVFIQILASGESAQCWFVQPGRAAEPFAFRRAPGPRNPDGSIAHAADTEAQRKMQQEGIGDNGF